jgi:hypothetical protein
VVDHDLDDLGAVAVGDRGQPGRLPAAGLLAGLLLFHGDGDRPRPRRLPAGEEAPHGDFGRGAGAGPPLLPGPDAQGGDQEAAMLGLEGVVAVEDASQHGHDQV